MLMPLIPVRRRNRISATPQTPTSASNDYRHMSSGKTNLMFARHAALSYALLSFHAVMRRRAARSATRRYAVTRLHRSTTPVGRA